MSTASIAGLEFTEKTGPTRCLGRAISRVVETMVATGGGKQWGADKSAKWRRPQWTGKERRKTRSVATESSHLVGLLLDANDAGCCSDKGRNKSFMKDEYHRRYVWPTKINRWPAQSAQLAESRWRVHVAKTSAEADQMQQPLSSLSTVTGCQPRREAEGSRYST